MSYKEFTDSEWVHKWPHVAGRHILTWQLEIGVRPVVLLQFSRFFAFYHFNHSSLKNCCTWQEKNLPWILSTAAGLLSALTWRKLIWFLISARTVRGADKFEKKISSPINFSTFNLINKIKSKIILKDMDLITQQSGKFKFLVFNSCGRN